MVGVRSVPLPNGVVQGVSSTRIRGIPDILLRGRPEHLPQHRAKRGSRLVEPSERVRGPRSSREEPKLGGRRLVGVGRHLGACGSTDVVAGVGRVVCVRGPPLDNEVCPVVMSVVAVGYGDEDLEKWLAFSFV